MPNYVYIATSLDGYIAEKDGGIDFLDKIPNPDKSDMGWNKFISKIDAIVMGKNSFQKVQSFGFWPYDRPVYVLSRSLRHVPEDYQDKVTLLSGCPNEIVTDLSSKGHQHLYIDGGIVVQSFLKEDLVDYLIVTKIPVILGNGIPLFGNQENQLWFELEKTETHLQQLVTCHYKRTRDEP